MTVAAAILLVTANAAGHPTLSDTAVRDYARIVQAESDRFSLDALALVALVSKESDWRARAVNATTGATGLGQLMPRSDATKGFDDYDITDPRVNLYLTARRLARFTKLCRGDVWRGVDGYDGRNVRRKALSPFAIDVRARWQRLQDVVADEGVNR